MAPRTEAFRPPLNRGAAGGASRWRQVVRRLFDFQVGSVYADIRGDLAGWDGVVLEIGAGEQPYRHLLPSRVRYVALEWRQAGATFGYGQGADAWFDGAAFPVRTASCDRLLHTEVLEHVWEMRGFLGECRRVLRPGGIMLFTLPFAARWHFIPHDYWRLTPSALTRLCREAGFTEISVRARGTDLNVACYKINSVAYRWLLTMYRLPSPWRYPATFMAAAMLAWPILGGALVNILCSRCRWGSPDDPLGYTVTATAG